MKIEKVNDHQIRCTLTRDDLAKRDLKITELAYGTDKAKELSEDLRRKVTVEELMEETGWDEDKIRSAIKFSGDNIEDLDSGKEDK